MARQGQGPQRPIKGFRPGKEPPQLRKRMARQQFGELSPTQERLVEAFAGRSPEEARAMIRRWKNVLLGVAVFLGILTAVLSAWSLVAAVIAGILAVVVFYLWWRLRRQSAELEAMADAVTGRPPRKRRRGR